MENKKDDPPKKGFQGIKKGFLKLLTNEEYVKQTFGEEVDTTKVSSPQVFSKPTPYVKPVGTVVLEEEVKAVLNKIYSKIEEINQPGIDFLEVYNAASNNGGISEQTLSSTYKILKSVQPDLTIVSLTQSGEGYLQKISTAMQIELNGRTSEKETLLKAQEKERKDLAQSISECQQKINELNGQLAEKQNQLTSIDSKYTPQVLAVDSKIAAGQRALEIVTNSFRGAIVLLANIK